MTAKTLKHKFPSSVADGTDTTLVRPSSWNDDHNLWLGGRTITIATDTIADSDHLSLLKYNRAAAIAATLPSPTGSTFVFGWMVYVRNLGVGAVTFTCSGATTINGAASLTLNQNDFATIVSDGTNYDAMVVPAPVAAAPVEAPSGGGRLAYSSATALTFRPFGNNKIKINGAIYTIPVAGIAGLANTSVYINGTAGQNLAANTVYRVYAFNNAGTITADFSTTTHMTSTTSGNEGIEIKTGDDTRTLIGMIRTNASSQFVDAASQRFILSWFNRRGIVSSAGLATTGATANTSYTEINSSEIRSEFLTWGEEAVSAALCGNCSLSAAGYCAAGLCFDGIVPSGATGWYGSVTGVYNNIGIALAGINLAEGYHYATLVGSTGSSGYTVTFQASDSPGGASKCRTSVLVRG